MAGERRDAYIICIALVAHTNTSRRSKIMALVAVTIIVVSAHKLERSCVCECVLEGFFAIASVVVQLGSVLAICV